MLSGVSVVAKPSPDTNVSTLLQGLVSTPVGRRLRASSLKVSLASALHSSCNQDLPLPERGGDYYASRIAPPSVEISLSTLEVAGENRLDLTSRAMETSAILTSYKDKLDAANLEACDRAATKRENEISHVDERRSKTALQSTKLSPHPQAARKQDSHTRSIASAHATHAMDDCAVGLSTSVEALTQSDPAVNARRCVQSQRRIIVRGASISPFSPSASIPFSSPSSPIYSSPTASIASPPFASISPSSVPFASIPLSSFPSTHQPSKQTPPDWQEKDVFIHQPVCLNTDFRRRLDEPDCLLDRNETHINGITEGGADSKSFVKGCNGSALGSDVMKTSDDVTSAAARHLKRYEASMASRGHTRETKDLIRALMRGKANREAVAGRHSPIHDVMSRRRPTSVQLNESQRESKFSLPGEYGAAEKSDLSVESKALGNLSSAERAVNQLAYRPRVVAPLQRVTRSRSDASVVARHTDAALLPNEDATMETYRSTAWKDSITSRPFPATEFRTAFCLHSSMSKHSSPVRAKTWAAPDGHEKQSDPIPNNPYPSLDTPCPALDTPCPSLDTPCPALETPCPASDTPFDPRAILRRKNSDRRASNSVTRTVEYLESLPRRAASFSGLPTRRIDQPASTRPSTHPETHTDTQPDTHPDTYTDIYSNTYGDTYANNLTDSYPDAYPNTHPDTYPNINSNTYGDTYANDHTDTYPHTCLDTIVTVKPGVPVDKPRTTPCGFRDENGSLVGRTGAEARTAARIRELEEELRYLKQLQRGSKAMTSSRGNEPLMTSSHDEFDGEAFVVKPAAEPLMMSSSNKFDGEAFFAKSAAEPLATSSRNVLDREYFVAKSVTRPAQNEVEDGVKMGLASGRGNSNDAASASDDPSESSLSKSSLTVCLLPPTSEISKSPSPTYYRPERGPNLRLERAQLNGYLPPSTLRPLSTTASLPEGGGPSAADWESFAGRGIFSRTDSASGGGVGRKSPRMATGGLVNSCETIHESVPFVRSEAASGKLADWKQGRHGELARFSNDQAMINEKVFGRETSSEIARFSPRTTSVKLSSCRETNGEMAGCCDDAVNRENEYRSDNGKPCTNTHIYLDNQSSKGFKIDDISTDDASKRKGTLTDNQVYAENNHHADSVISLSNVYGASRSPNRGVALSESQTTSEPFDYAKTDGFDANCNSLLAKDLETNRRSPSNSSAAKKFEPTFVRRPSPVELADDVTLTDDDVIDGILSANIVGEASDVCIQQVLEANSEQLIQTIRVAWPTPADDDDANFNRSTEKLNALASGVVAGGLMECEAKSHRKSCDPSTPSGNNSISDDVIIRYDSQGIESSQTAEKASRNSVDNFIKSYLEPAAGNAQESSKGQGKVEEKNENQDVLPERNPCLLTRDDSTNITRPGSDQVTNLCTADTVRRLHESVWSPTERPEPHRIPYCATVENTTTTNTNYVSIIDEATSKNEHFVKELNAMDNIQEKPTSPRQEKADMIFFDTADKIRKKSTVIGSKINNKISFDILDYCAGEEKELMSNESVIDEENKQIPMAFSFLSQPTEDIERSAHEMQVLKQKTSSSLRSALFHCPPQLELASKTSPVSVKDSDNLYFLQNDKQNLAYKSETVFCAKQAIDGNVGDPSTANNIFGPNPIRSGATNSSAQPKHRKKQFRLYHPELISSDSVSSNFDDVIGRLSDAVVKRVCGLMTSPSANGGGGTTVIRKCRSDETRPMSDVFKMLPLVQGKSRVLDSHQRSSRDSLKLTSPLRRSSPRDLRHDANGSQIEGGRSLNGNIWGDVRNDEQGDNNDEAHGSNNKERGNSNDDKSSKNDGRDNNANEKESSCRQNLEETRGPMDTAKLCRQTRGRLVTRLVEPIDGQRRGGTTLPVKMDLNVPTLPIEMDLNVSALPIGMDLNDATRPMEMALGVVREKCSVGNECKAQPLLLPKGCDVTGSSLPMTSSVVASPTKHRALQREFPGCDELENLVDMKSFGSGAGRFSSEARSCANAERNVKDSVTDRLPSPSCELNYRFDSSGVHRLLPPREFDVSNAAGMASVSSSSRIGSAFTAVIPSARKANDFSQSRLSSSTNRDAAFRDDPRIIRDVANFAWEDRKSNPASNGSVFDENFPLAESLTKRKLDRATPLARVLQYRRPISSVAAKPVGAGFLSRTYTGQPEACGDILKNCLRGTQSLPTRDFATKTPTATRIPPTENYGTIKPDNSSHLSHLRRRGEEDILEKLGQTHRQAATVGGIRQTASSFEDYYGDLLRRTAQEGSAADANENCNRIYGPQQPVLSLSRVREVEPLLSRDQSIRQAPPDVRQVEAPLSRDSAIRQSPPRTSFMPKPSVLHSSCMIGRSLPQATRGPLRGDQNPATRGALRGDQNLRIAQLLHEDSFNDTDSPVLARKQLPLPTESNIMRHHRRHGGGSARRKKRGSKEAAGGGGREGAPRGPGGARKEWSSASSETSSVRSDPRVRATENLRRREMESAKRGKNRCRDAENHRLWTDGQKIDEGDEIGRQGGSSRKRRVRKSKDLAADVSTLKGPERGHLLDGVDGGMSVEGGDWEIDIGSGVVGEVSPGRGGGAWTAVGGTKNVRVFNRR